MHRHRFHACVVALASLGLLALGCTRQATITEVIRNPSEASQASSADSPRYSTAAHESSPHGALHVDSPTAELPSTDLTSPAIDRLVSDTSAADTSEPGPRATAAEGINRVEWRQLFDGQSMTGWKVTEFGGNGEVFVEDGQITLEHGYPMTGVTSTLEDLPKSNYEIELQAMRMEGSDFFCCLTLPVKELHCSFVAGGWGGATVGISSIDFMDASENETMTIRSFKNKQWYQIRVRVTDTRIQAWIDDEQVVDVNIEGRKISMRSEVLKSRPLGICAFDSQAGLRAIQIRNVEPEKAADGE